MSSQVFYRKWRPQTLSEVVGQEHVSQTLRNAIKSGKVAHAYLFCGPRGTGKTSTGRILAKAINCLDPVNGEPCNKCQMCLSFNDGSGMDIIEIDAASNRGIDAIRELIEKVHYAPSAAKYKVYIVDEVHMITDQAANAFLKTLEEPPPHAYFILATTDPHKVIPTILSRCQRFDFHRLSQAAVMSKLNFVSEKENIKIEPESLRLVARVTTGSLRDAENMLEQLVAYYGHEISLDQVRAMLGITNDPRTIELGKNIVNKDLTAGLKNINSVSADGFDLQQFNQELISYLRNLLMAKSGSDDTIDVTKEELAELKTVANNATLEFLLNAVKFFGEIDFRNNNYSSLPLELALVDTILSSSKEKESAARSPVTPPEAAQPAVHIRKPPAPKTEYVHPASDAAAKTKPEVAEPKHDPVPEKAAAEIKEELKEVALTPDGDEFHQIQHNWKVFINALRGEGSTGNLDAFLRSACEPLKLDDNVLTVGFYHKFHRDYIDDPKYRFLVEKKLREVFNKPYKLSCVITERKKEAASKSAESLLVNLAQQRGAKIIGQKQDTE